MKRKKILAAFVYSEDVAAFLFPLVGTDDLTEGGIQCLVIDCATEKIQHRFFTGVDSDNEYCVEYKMLGSHFLYVVSLLVCV